MPSPVFTDENGYRRWAGDGRLVHRGVAYKKIYLPNKDSYPLAFSQYVIHHKDKNKKNNDVSNLQILTREEHERIHNGCFIATAAYGTPFAEEINALREWRDNTLRTNIFGRVFIKTYYFFSPLMAGFIRNKPVLRKVVRILLRPLIGSLKRKYK